MVISPFKKLSPLPLSLTDSLTNVTLRIEEDKGGETDYSKPAGLVPCIIPFYLLLLPAPHDTS